MKNLYVHIGTHKTGSTSLQRWLSGHESLLNAKGYGLYKGVHNHSNHVELYLAAMRYERDSFGKQAMPEVTFDEHYTSKVSERVRAFLSECAQENLILSTEGLSLLRHEDEIQRLARVLGSDYETITIILFLRDKQDYLHSYRKQLDKKKGRVPSTDYWSALYVEDDTWLTDYQQLIEAYAGVFGTDQIAVIDYDKEMQARGNIIPAFLETIGLEVSPKVAKTIGRYRHNATPGSPSSETRTGSIVRRLLQRLGVG